MRFDWYQATIHGKPMEVLGRIATLGVRTVKNDGVARVVRGHQGWDVLGRGDRPIAHVAVGGQFGSERAHAWATSEDAAPFAELVRNEWPELHLVTRVDPCEDFVDASAFKRLVGVGRKVAKKHRTKFARVRDALDSTAGQTQYIGSPKSEYRVRIYEKGWEVLSKSSASLGRKGFDAADVKTIRVPGINIECHPKDWIRAELQAHPKDEAARRAAAQASPEELWTFTAWSQEFAREALALDLERAYIRQRKISTDEKALRFMCKQYGKMLQRQHDALGDWACVGLTIGELVAHLAEQEPY